MKKIEINPERLTELHEQGLSDSKIAEYFNCNSETIRNRRKKLGLLSNQGVTIDGVHRKQTAIKLEVLKPLVEQNLSDYKISEILGYNHATVFQARQFYNLTRESLKIATAVKPTSRQVELLIGHILGDGSLRRDCTNTSGRVSQGITQLEYAEWKVRELTPLCGRICINTRKTIDKRTGLYYTSADAYIFANPELNWLYDLFYQSGKKEVYSDLIEFITPLSLAVWFMDDGYISPKGYSIATQNFTNISVLKQIFQKFEIMVAVHKSGVTYIPAVHAKKFANLVYSHMIPSMFYKIHRSHVTPLIQGNPQGEAILSQAPVVIQEKGATTKCESVL